MEPNYKRPSKLLYLPTRRLSLVQKIIAGYCAISFFTVIALAIATMGIVSIHRTAREIAQTDLILINNAQRLRESLVAQERYVGKFLILGGSEFNDLFLKREKEFQSILRETLLEKDLPELRNLYTLYLQYSDSADNIFQKKNVNPEEMQSAAAKLFTTIDSITNNERLRIRQKLEVADQREQSTVKWTLILTFTGFILAAAVAAYVTYSISSAIRKLKKATHRIAAGEFDYDPQIPVGDEIGDLARDFTHMACRLKELEQVSLDASPLTRLPGNIAIERILNQRLEEGVPFAVCYADLDNFKAYNDRYGYIKASELIKKTGEIIYEESFKCAGDDAFVGHVGGDDFVVVLDADLATEFCKAVIREFDREIVTHYSSEDLQKGAIVGVDRYGVQRTFPIMTISIAVVVCQRGAEYDSAVEIAKAAAQIKDHLKGMPGSDYFVNRRKGSR